MRRGPSWCRPRRAAGVSRLPTLITPEARALVAKVLTEPTTWPTRRLSNHRVLPVIAPQPALNAGNRRSWLGSAGIRASRADELWYASSSLSDRQSRPAFLRTLRSVVDYRGQAVSALNRLHLNFGLPVMLMWGVSRPDRPT